MRHVLVAMNGYMYAHLLCRFQYFRCIQRECNTIVRHQMIWDYFRFDLTEDWPHLIVDDYAAALR
jgi:hypothetical protein